MENKHQMQKYPSAQHEEKLNQKATLTNTSSDRTVETLMEEIENYRKELESRDQELLRMKNELEQAMNTLNKSFTKHPWATSSMMIIYACIKSIEPFTIN